jgi:2-amino-4-hydroxy-6-hydroxymethyldihydropteridine diphosphokinase
VSAYPQRAYVALGSNLGDRRAELERAVERLDRAPGVRVVKVSEWVETEPVGGPPGQGKFLNGAVEIDTTLEPRELLDLLHAIERQAGRAREREVRNGPRALDLDLLLYGELSIDERDLLVPHPRLEEREFVLKPLAQIAPHCRLPASRQTVRERLDELQAHPRPRPAP